MKQILTTSNLKPCWQFGLTLVAASCLFYPLCGTAIAQSFDRNSSWQEVQWQDASTPAPREQAQNVGRSRQRLEPGSPPPVTGGVQQADFQTALPEPHFASGDGHGAVPIPNPATDPTGTAAWTRQIQNQFTNLNWPRVLSSLAIVIGGYLAFVWAMRKFTPAGRQGLPSAVFELIGTTRLNSKQNLQLVRLGSKLLLLVSGEEGVNPIAEVTDPEEVEYLTGLCQQSGPARRRRTERTSWSGARNFGSALDRTRNEGRTTEAALDKVIRKLTEMTAKPGQTDYEA